MAKVYYNQKQTHIPPPAVGYLPIDPLRQKFYDTRSQRLIPFLGAGASRTDQSKKKTEPPARRPSEQTLDTLCSELAILDPVARRFIEVALQFAQLVDKTTRTDAADASYAPSSWELATLLADVLPLHAFHPLSNKLKTVLQEPADRGDYVEIIARVADVLELSQSVPQLLTVASCFNETHLREMLRDNLFDRIHKATYVTKTQNMVAATAQRFVTAQQSADTPRKLDYLIITTNYDQLIERRLDELAVPTIVVTVDEASRIVATPFPDAATLRQRLPVDEAQWLHLCRTYGIRPEKHAGTDLPDPPIAAANFVEPTDATKAYSLALVYKIHGCPIVYHQSRSLHAPEPPDRFEEAIDDPSRWDSIVISDQDYVRFIQFNNTNIPGYFSTRARRNGLMFLGYSFSDWNVRALYHRFVESRYASEDAKKLSPDELRTRDYVVLRGYEEQDAYFFNPWDVSVLVTDLNDLVDALESR
jgi:hypothetical protein